MECLYCSATFHLGWVKSLAAERQGATFDKINQGKDVFFCIRGVHERTSEMQLAGTRMLNAEWLVFEGEAWFLAAGESLCKRRGFKWNKLRDTYVWLPGPCASGNLENLW